MVASGSLRLIRDDSLRILLASFVRTVDDTQSSLTQLESNFSLLLTDPYFQQNLGVWGLYPSSVKEARGLPSGARFSINFERLRHDREFGNLAIRGYIYKRNRVWIIRNLLSAVQELRAALVEDARR